MGLKHYLSDIGALKVGSAQVSKAYLGADLAWTHFSVSAPDINASNSGAPAVGTSTATVTGGTGPFTYTWVITSGSGFSLSNTTN